MRQPFLVLAVLSILLSACSTVEHGPVVPDPAAGCAKTSGDDETDGGLGGTGNAPPGCYDATAP